MHVPLYAFFHEQLTHTSHVGALRGILYHSVVLYTTPWKLTANLQWRAVFFHASEKNYRLSEDITKIETKEKP